MTSFLFRLALGAGLIVATLMLAAPTALADSDAGACNIPMSRPPAGSIAANIPGFVISGNEFGTPAAVFVRVASDGGETAVDFTYGAGGAFPYLSYSVIPTAPLELGAHYRIYPGECRLGRPGTNVPFDYVVGAEVPLPATLGTLSFTPLQHSFYDDYYFDATLTPSAEMAPWVWAYTAVVSAGGGRDVLGQPVLTTPTRIRVACDPTTAAGWNVDPGDVDVVYTTTSYFGAAGPTASGVTHVDCASAIEVDPPDAGPSDGGVDRDASVPVPADASCSASPGHPTRGTYFAALLFSALLIASRSARRSRSR